MSASSDALATDSAVCAVTELDSSRAAASCSSAAAADSTRLDRSCAPPAISLLDSTTSELLDWLERRFSLVWLEAEPDAAPARALGADALPSALAAMPAPPIRPSPVALEALREVVALGYYRGIMNQLDALDANEPHCHDLVAVLRPLAQQFQFEALSQKLSLL